VLRSQKLSLPAAAGSCLPAIQLVCGQLRLLPGVVVPLLCGRAVPFPQAFTHLALIEAVSQLIEEEARLKALSA
jgi:hypothetical protein